MMPIMVRWSGLLVCALLLWAGSAQAVVRYMATNGNNANDCSATGSQDITKPKATFASAIPCMAPGDTLSLRGGTYVQQINSNNYSMANGTSWTNALTITSYPNETAIIRPSSGSDAVNLPNKNYIILERLTIDGANATESSISHGSGGGHHLRVLNCDVKNADAPNIFAGDFSEILNSKIHDSGSSYGLYIFNNDVLIEGNEIYNNAGMAFQYYHALETTVHNGIARNNRIYGNGFIRGTSAVTLSSGTNIQFYNNLVYNNYGGVDVYKRSTNAQVYNNTIYNNSPRAAVEFQGATNPVVRNNILFQNAANIVTAGTGTTGIAQSNNLTSNPLFVNAAGANFQLQAGSPMINTGFTLGAPWNVDFLGTARPQGAAYDVGAYEFGSTTPPILLVFQAPPTTTFANTFMPPVTVCGQINGVTQTSFTTPIALSITTHPPAVTGTLTGGAAVAAVAGCSQYSTANGNPLSINNFGNGYRLMAVATGATSVVSPLFNILEVTLDAPQQLQIGTVR